jgi:hypothetical protein
MENLFIFFILFILSAIVIVAVVVMERNKRKKLALMTPDERNKYLREKQLRQEELAKRVQESLTINQYGPINPAMVCPHCQTKGQIRTKYTKQKKGISGSKATAALLTGGLSILAVGLSRKEGATQAHCGKCNNTWLF